MTDAEFEESALALKQKYPAMFHETGLKEGEVCVDMWPADVVGVNLRIYKKDGLSSIRSGEAVPAGPDKLMHCHVFVNLREYLEYKEKKEKTLDVRGQVPDPSRGVTVRVEGVGEMKFGAPLIESIDGLAAQVLVARPVAGAPRGVVLNFSSDSLFDFVSWDKNQRIVTVRKK